MEKGGAVIPYKGLLWTVLTSTSDKPDASAATDNNHPDGRFSYSCTSKRQRATQQTSPRRINVLLGKALLVRTESCITSVGVWSN